MAMHRLRIKIGHKFSRLTVIRTNGSTASGKRNWKCKCDCGRFCDADSTALIAGKKKSCGCLKPEVASIRKTTHGLAGSPAYVTWSGMLSRCRNPKIKSYKDYGGLGVVVCERWHKFENFYADMGIRPDGMSLDRINPFGNYELSNCKWSTRSEQAKNTRGAAALKILAKMQAAKQSAG